MTPEEAFAELSYYTLELRDAFYTHQLIVDAFGAQTAEADSKPIRLVFSLVGLYLVIERGYTGRQVQRAHMELAREKQDWPRLVLPAERGAVTAHDVLSAPVTERQAMIRRWCESVWNAYEAHHEYVAELVSRRLKIRHSLD